MFNNMSNDDIYTSDIDMVIDASNRLARERRLCFEWYHDINMFDDRRCIALRFKRNSYPFEFNDFRFYPGYSSHKFLSSLESSLDEWISEDVEESKPQTYRDQIVKQIKAAGQDLIDRAESFVAADLDMIGGFNIEIDIPQDGPVEIVTKMKTYCNSDKYYTLSSGTSDKKGE